MQQIKFEVDTSSVIFFKGNNGEEDCGMHFHVQIMKTKVIVNMTGITTDVEYILQIQQF